MGCFFSGTEGKEESEGRGWMSEGRKVALNPAGQRGAVRTVESGTQGAPELPADTRVYPEPEECVALQRLFNESHDVLVKTRQSSFEEKYSSFKLTGEMNWGTPNKNLMKRVYFEQSAASDR